MCDSLFRCNIICLFFTCRYISNFKFNNETTFWLQKHLETDQDFLFLDHQLDLFEKLCYVSTNTIIYMVYNKLYTYMGFFYSKGLQKISLFYTF